MIEAFGLKHDGVKVIAVNPLTRAEGLVLRLFGILQQLANEGLVVSKLGLDADTFPPTCTAAANKPPPKKEGMK